MIRFRSIVSKLLKSGNPFEWSDLSLQIVVFISVYLFIRANYILCLPSDRHVRMNVDYWHATYYCMYLLVFKCQILSSGIPLLSVSNEITAEIRSEIASEFRTCTPGHTCRNLHAQTHTDTVKGGDKIVWFSIKYTNHVYIHTSRMNLCVSVFFARATRAFISYARAWWRSKWNVAAGELCYCESDVWDRARLYYYYYYYLNEGKTRKGLTIRVKKKIGKVREEYRGKVKTGEKHVEILSDPRPDGRR